MPSDFDKLFGWMPEMMRRHEDGTAYLDRQHAAVKEILSAIQACRDAGDSEEVIGELLMRGMIKGLQRSGVIDGTHP